MRKLLVVSAFALATMTSGAMAAEQLTASQLDKVTAGGGWQSNNNYTKQIAVAVAVAKGGCEVVCYDSGNALAAASASNTNVTGQANVD